MPININKSAPNPDVSACHCSSMLGYSLKLEMVLFEEESEVKSNLQLHIGLESLEEGVFGCSLFAHIDRLHLLGKY